MLLTSTPSFKEKRLNPATLIDWFITPLHWLTWNTFKAFRLNWIKRSPSLAMALKLVEDIDIPLKSQLTLLNFEALKIIQGQTNYFTNTVLRENEEAEEKLLSSSSLNWFPHETAQIRIVNAQGENFCSKVFHGGRSSLGNVEQLRFEIRRMIFKARKKGLTIEEVEIAHTHPSLEVMIESGEKSQFIFNGLSRSDRRFGERLAPFLDYPLRVKAITPAANYSCLY